MTNNSIFTRVLALMLCLIMLVGTLTACLNQVEPENHVGTTNGGVVTTNPTTKPTTTTTTTPTTGDVVEDDPVEDPVEPVDPNEIFSASTNILSDALIYGSLASDVVIGGAEMGALVPADVKVEAGASSLALSVKKVDEVLLSDALSTLDVHINGVALDNTVPMVVKLGAILEAGLGATELKLYHTENGVDNLMTRVNSPADFAIHNQYYYNAETGEVTIYVASFSVFTAVQSTASVWTEETVADYDWYKNPDENGNYTLKDVADFLGFRNIVDGTAIIDDVTVVDTFAGKTVTLGTDLDLNKKLFNPIGGGWAYNGGKTFNGTFDGGNHTIYNLRVNGWELDETGDKHSGTSMGAGLFSSLHNATIRNLAVVGSELIVETTSIGIIAGVAQGKCTFENIVVSDATLGNYQMRNGGIVGDIYVIESDNVPEGEDKYSHTFTNIVVDSTVKLSSMWGDFDTGNGGVIGGKYGSSKVLMENVTVACELDVFSDVTAAYQWYAYRRCGMLVGYTGQNSPKQATNAAADFLTCKNVSVYYGDWVNYTYYQFTNQDSETGRRYPWVRAQESPYNSAFSNVRYGVPTHTNANGEVIKVTSENAEQYKTGFAAITFNQLYGGGQGVYGCAEHDGVVTNSKEFKTIYVHNTANWTNLKLQYWFANEGDTWTTIIDGIDMNTMLVEGNVYKIQLPVSVYAFKIVADGQDGEEFVLGNLESNANVYPGCEHTYKNACDADCNVCGATREVTHTPGDVATCTTAQVCTVCDTELVKALGHTEVVDKAVTATCTTAGKTEGSHCSVCNTVIKAQTTVAALGHNWKADPYKCSVCSTLAETKTIYFQNNWLWSDVRIYYWSSDGSYPAAWPGQAMTFDYKIGSINYYTFEIPSYADKFIISGVKNDNSGNRDQSPEIKVSTVVDGNIYYMDWKNDANAVGNTNISEYVKIYLKPNSNWTSSNAWFTARIWNNNTEDAWFKMTKEGDYYYCYVPKEYSNVIFCRMNSSADSNNPNSYSWDYKWDQTSDLKIPTNGNNCYTIAAGAWSKGSGSWSKYTPN